VDESSDSTPNDTPPSTPPPTHLRQIKFAPLDIPTPSGSPSIETTPIGPASFTIPLSTSSSFSEPSSESSSSSSFSSSFSYAFNHDLTSPRPATFLSPGNGSNLVMSTSNPSTLSQVSSLGPPSPPESPHRTPPPSPSVCNPHHTGDFPDHENRSATPSLSINMTPKVQDEDHSTTGN